MFPALEVFTMLVILIIGIVIGMLCSSEKKDVAYEGNTDNDRK